MKKRNFSGSESSWSSVEEIETKVLTEKNDGDDNLGRSKKELQMKIPQRNMKGNRESETSRDSEEAAQLRPLLTPSS